MPAAATTATPVPTTRRDADARSMSGVRSGRSAGSGCPGGVLPELSSLPSRLSRHPWWWEDPPGRGTPDTCGCGLELPAADEAEPEDPLDELDPLLVLREVLDVELLEQRAQMGLHGVDAEEQLVGDLLVGRRGRV